jgi:hypothetical protein
MDGGILHLQQSIHRPSILVIILPLALPLFFLKVFAAVVSFPHQTLHCPTISRKHIARIFFMQASGTETTHVTP